ncbi:MAG: nicotinate phosphoribosyltransferase [Methanomassiliicoccaceae archaeon]|jgi:nicotinate phosphoribosyltransferase|nr:nicotinate phosphoribosyltransferase [Methanomassiliicoccaceae archaeon]
MDRLFAANEKEIRDAYTTDVYFERTNKILNSKGLGEADVWAEFTLGSLPKKWPWAVLCGTEEVLRLTEGMNVDIFGVPEGTIFRTRSPKGIRVPLMNIHGRYTDFGEMETAMLGMLCHPSGVATAAARVRCAAKEKKIMAFGNRRMHPAISGVLDRSAYIGGCDDVASKIGADIIGKEAAGTVPHALMLMMGSDEAAFRAFDETIEKIVPRIMLIYTFSDEREASINACKIVKDLKGVRLDTPSSRRGSLKEIIQEVRWELDSKGYKNVEIIASGGLNENSIRELMGSGVSGFGVGTSISNAPTLDISMDLVCKNGSAISKKGKFGGRKYTYRCPRCLSMDVSLSENDSITCSCGSGMEPFETPLLKAGKRVHNRSPAEIRKYVLAQLKQLGEL